MFLHFAHLKESVSAEEARESKEDLHGNVRADDHGEDDLLEEVNNLPGVDGLSEHEELSCEAEGTQTV